MTTEQYVIWLGHSPFKTVECSLQKAITIAEEIDADFIEDQNSRLVWSPDREVPFG